MTHLYPNLKYNAINGTIDIVCSGPCGTKFASIPSDYHLTDDCVAPATPPSAAETVAARIKTFTPEEIAALKEALK